VKGTVEELWKERGEVKDMEQLRKLVFSNRGQLQSKQVPNANSKHRQQFV